MSADNQQPVVLSDSTRRLAAALQEYFQEATQAGREEFRVELRHEMAGLRTEMAELRAHVDARLDFQDERLHSIEGRLGGVEEVLHRIRDAKPNGPSPV